MNLSHIVLNTSDRSVLSNYICEIFDKEVSVEKDEYTISMGGIDLVLREVTLLEPRDSEHTLLEFKLDSLQELEDLLKKVQFYYYRLNAGNKDGRKYAIPEIQGDDFVHYFEVKDTDDRKWKFMTLLQ